MKIGIVTVYEAANFGSYLQAFALWRTLAEMGHDARFIINEHPDVPYRRQFYHYPVSRRSLRHPIDVLREYRDGRVRCRAFEKEVARLPLIDMKDVESLDRVIIGSDEIWNVTMRCFTSPFYYGKDMPRRMTYAVSAGRAEVRDFDQFPELRELMRGATPLLVRDRHTAEVVEGITGQKTKIVCDPTLLLPVSEFTAELHDLYLEEHKYILVYSYPGYFTEQVVTYIRRFAREEHLSIVSACFYLPWADYVLNCSPMEFCEALTGASYVFTTTFHGTIFSILNHRQFISMPSGIKVTQILDTLGQKSAMFEREDSYRDFVRKMKTPRNYEETERTIGQLRKEGKGALADALAGKEESHG